MSGEFQNSVAKVAFLLIYYLFNNLINISKVVSLFRNCMLYCVATVDCKIEVLSIESSLCFDRGVQLFTISTSSHIKTQRAQKTQN